MCSSDLGWIAHLFEYVSGSLKDVTFEVYALEDIKAADGESADYYKKDELIAEITTDDTGVASLGNLPLGKYFVKEKETAEGYVLDGEIREIDLTYRDQHTAALRRCGADHGTVPSATLPALGLGAAYATRCPATWGLRWARGIPIRCCPFFFFVASERLSHLPTGARCGRHFSFSAASQ